ncbi:MAG: branched-chain amino acid ABC transporter permease, partial [Abitibacteriaceae bacterium]|nr:branched-chain amino acid ABC transporter permease [Abditibacteriaceae bacterium]
GTIYALVALGFAMVYGVLRFLNFAHSEVFTAGAFIGDFVLRATLRVRPDEPAVAVTITFMAAALGAGCLAMLIYAVAYRPLLGQPRLRMLLAAIGVSILLQDLGIQLFSAHTQGYPPLTLPLAVAPRWLAVAVLLISYATLQGIIYHTKAGINIRAVAENPDVAALMGIKPLAWIYFPFFLGGAFAGIAGVTWGLVYGTVHPQMGFYPGMKAFIIAVAGGIGNLRGTFLMGILFGLLEVSVSSLLPSTWSGLKDTATFGILIAFLIWRPAGFMGTVQVPKV